MAESKEKVQAKLRELLNERPGLSTDELQAAALEIDPALATLSRRQFNAGFVLPLKRRGGVPKAAKPARSTRRRGKGRLRKPRATASSAAAPAANTPPARRGRRPATTTASPTGGNDRERVREVLLRFARDLTRAESRTEIIDVLGSLDVYADDVLKAAR
jgi:hypothetical protein